MYNTYSLRTPLCADSRTARSLRAGILVPKTYLTF